MAKSSIEWTQVTWNPTTGCTHISKECENCYAERETNRKMHNPKQPKYKMGFDVVVEHPSTLLEPFTWKKPTTVFVNSMSDLFHKDISLEFIKRVFDVMNNTPEHTYQVLTKRHDILLKYSDELTWSDNIWMGVSVGMKVATRRIEALVKCGAKHKFLSIEPLIEDLGEFSLKGIDLVFVGGESGSNKARHMKLEWVMNVLEQCKKDNVVFFFKQWGKTRNNPDPNDPTISKKHTFHAKGGCLLNGKLYLDNPSSETSGVKTIDLFGEKHLIVDDYKELNAIWELKTYLPMMEDELYNQLKQNIKENGINDPILYSVIDGKKLVIEGHTRLSVAIDLKLKDFHTKEIKDKFESINDIKLWMIKHQFQRRNLSNVEKINLAMLSKDSIVKIAKENLSKAGKKEGVEDTIDTNEEIAKIAGVGRASVVRYASVIAKGSQSLIEMMKKSELSISKAYNSVKDKPEKTNILNKPKPEHKYSIIESIDEGIEKIKEGLIDYFIVSGKDNIEQLKSKPSVRIGLYLFANQKNNS